LEGVDAVVSAAEEEQSPAILQVGSTLQALSDLAWGDFLNIKSFLCFHLPT
jgi:fructose/tagatose bisphosphate aldolase